MSITSRNNPWERLLKILIIVVILSRILMMQASAEANASANLFYYVIIPGVVVDTRSYVLSVVCIRLDSSGANSSVTGMDKDKRGDFYSLWYPVRAYIPNNPTNNQPQDGSLSVNAGKMNTGDREKEHELPDSIVNLLSAIHNIREHTSKELICQPMFSSLNEPSAWQNVDHLNIFVTMAATLSSERSKWITHSIYGEMYIPPHGSGKDWIPSLDVAIALREKLSWYCNIQDIRYWPEYNVIVIKADAEFGKKASTAFQIF